MRRRNLAQSSNTNSSNSSSSIKEWYGFQTSAAELIIKSSQITKEHAEYRSKGEMSPHDEKAQAIYTELYYKAKLIMDYVEKRCQANIDTKLDIISNATSYIGLANKLSLKLKSLNLNSSQTISLDQGISIYKELPLQLSGLLRQLYINKQEESIKIKEQNENKAKSINTNQTEMDALLKKLIEEFDSKQTMREHSRSSRPSKPTPKTNLDDDAGSDNEDHITQLNLGSAPVEEKFAIRFTKEELKEKKDLLKLAKANADFDTQIKINTVIA